VSRSAVLAFMISLVIVELASFVVIFAGYLVAGRAD
jgi:hypothetical protein